MGIDIITRRREWSVLEKAALLAEVDASGGKAAVVARRHGMLESVPYDWRSARFGRGRARDITGGTVSCVRRRCTMVLEIPRAAQTGAVMPPPRGRTTTTSVKARRRSASLGCPGGPQVLLDLDDRLGVGESPR